MGVCFPGTNVCEFSPTKLCSLKLANDNRPLLHLASYGWGLILNLSDLYGDLSRPHASPVTPTGTVISPPARVQAPGCEGISTHRTHTGVHTHNSSYSDLASLRACIAFYSTVVSLKVSARQ